MERGETKHQRRKRQKKHRPAKDLEYKPKKDVDYDKINKDMAAKFGGVYKKLKEQEEPEEE